MNDAIDGCCGSYNMGMSGGSAAAGGGRSFGGRRAGGRIKRRGRK